MAVGTEERPLRVAIVGAGPAGFYAAEALLKHSQVRAEVDLIERLPAPFGLVRYGVAPDHQKIKTASAAYERTAELPGFRFVGNVKLGRDVSMAELLERYDQVLLSTGCETDRRLGIEGEDLVGSYPATRFVAWYNGHPDYRDDSFDLKAERAVVVGVGDVATDLIRVLLMDRDALAKTDITDYALAALRESPVREVVVVARRSVRQLKMALKEIRGFAELDGIGVDIDAAEVEAALAEPELDRTDKKRLEYLLELAKNPPAGDKRVVFRFLRSPKELRGDGRLQEVVLEKNALVMENGAQKARGTGETETLKAGLLFKSIGYLGLPIEGVPFHERWATIPNAEGRVTDADGSAVARVYVAGWIKRGPSGVIGTNKADSVKTVAAMVEDAAALDATRTAEGAPALDALLAQREVRSVSWSDWKRIDAHELARGETRGKVREKLTQVSEVLAFLDEG